MEPIRDLAVWIWTALADLLLQGARWWRAERESLNQYESGGELTLVLKNTIRCSIDQVKKVCMFWKCSWLNVSKVGQLEIFPTTVDDFLARVKRHRWAGRLRGFSSKLIETSIRSTLLLLSRNVIQEEKWRAVGHYRSPSRYFAPPGFEVTLIWEQW